VDKPLSTTPEAATLRQVWRFVFTNLIWLGGGIAAGIALGVAAQKFLPPNYEAEGRFVVDELPFLENSSHHNSAADSGTQGDLVQSLIMGVPSSNLGREVAARLTDTGTWGAVDEKQLCFEDLGVKPTSLRNKKPVGNIRITPVRNSRSATIDVTSQSAEFAAAVANALLDELHNYNTAQGRLNALDMQKLVATARVESIRTQLAGVKQALDWQEQQVAQLDEYIKKGLPVDSFPDFVSDTTLNNLKTERLLEQGEYAAVARSSSGGPQLEKTKAKVDDINIRVDAQAQQLAQGLRSQLVGTCAQETNLESELAQRLDEIQQCSHRREEWVQSFGNLSMMKKMIADSTNSATQGGSVIVVVSRAVAPERAKSPKLWLNLLAGVFVCSFAGLMFSVALTLLDDRLISPQSVATLTNLPCVVTTRPGGIFSRKKIKNAPPQAPGYNPLRSRLLLDGVEKPLQIIGFTPARKNDQSSRTVADIALMLSRAGRRVLVVDLNFSKPRQYELLGIKPQPGLADWMISERPLEEYVWVSEDPQNSSLALLSWSPKLPPPTPDLLLRRPLAKILPRFGETWDFIFIDAPAISTSWELMLSLPPGNPVVITADRRRTRASQVSDTAIIAQNQSWNVAGVALQGC
jgi:uncharacterized protein involved in exopolysaccharide biosynthesis/Mrp family chromosome partitioning ATPase